MIAWDSSREATRALTDALPILKQADLVHVVIFNSRNNPDAHGEQPGADIAVFIAPQCQSRSLGAQNQNRYQ